MKEWHGDYPPGGRKCGTARSDRPADGQSRGDRDAPLRAAIGDLIAAGRVDVAVNLAGLTRLDARGLGELVVAMKALRHRGGRLALVAPAPRVAKMLAVTGLDAVFERCETEAQLLACDLQPPGGSGRRGQVDTPMYA